MVKFYLLSLPVFFSSLFNFFGNEEKPHKKDETRMTKIVNNSIRQLSTRYGVIPIGTGGSNVDHKSKREFVAFQLRQKISKEEARILIVEIVELLLHNINGNKEIKNYLYNQPFSYRNLEIALFIRETDNSKIFHPNIGLVNLTQRGTVNFVTYDPNDSFCGYATDIEESYEEAYKIVTQRDYPKE